MADFWTHILAGEQLIDSMKGTRWGKLLQEKKTLFNFACQGPDFLFYNDFLPWVKEKRGPAFGTLLHQQKIDDLLLLSIDYINEVKDTKEDDLTILQVYIAGLLFHFVIDNWTHPFINSKTDNSVEHKLLELSIDSYLIKEKGGKEAYRIFPVKAIDVGKELPVIIEKFYRKVLNSVTNKSIKIDFINDSYKDMKRVLAIYYSPYRVKKVIFNLLQYLSPLDLSKYNLFYPRNPDYPDINKEDYQEINNLLKRGVKEGKSLINSLFAPLFYIDGT